MWSTGAFLNKKKKKTKININLIVTILLMSVGGFLGGILMGKNLEADAGLETIIFEWILLCVGIYVAWMLQTVIHEAGHLLLGYMSGYEFVSFRVGSFMLIKDNGKMKLKRFSLAGTGGQCLMSPPDMVDGKYPVFWYNMGGSLLNIIATVICIGLYFIFKNTEIISMFFVVMIVMGIVFAFINGVPMQMDVINNDGYNAMELSKNPDALRSVWIQLNVNAEIAKGKRAKDMPAEWFEIPSEEEMKNSMISVLGVFAASRLMDEHRFEEAYELMKELLSADTGIMPVYRNMMISDCIFCEAIGECRQDVIEDMMTKELKQLYEAMKNHPSIIRSQYTYALLIEKDEQKAETIKKRFEKIKNSYPYPADYDAENELFQIIYETYNKRKHMVIGDEI